MERGAGPTERFTSRAEAYARGRPAYPPELLDLLRRECGLAPGWRVADIGSGTGLLSQLLLSFGCEVFGVEPNQDMRAAGERALANQSRFHSVDGRAEATGLESGAFHLATAGQAFHWFDAGPARAEFRRILKADGWAALVWNERVAASGFMADYEALRNRFAGERPHPESDAFDAFFGGKHWRLGKIANPREMDEPELLAFLQSCSGSPGRGSEAQGAMLDEAGALFRRYARGGRVTMVYETRVYYGRL